MANKTQAKTQVDNAATAIKSDIDTLPAGVNIKDGIVNFGPMRWSITMDAGRSATTAESLVTSIIAALDLAGRAYVVRRAGRRSDDSFNDGFRIETQLATYTIINVR